MTPRRRIAWWFALVFAPLLGAWLLARAVGDGGATLMLGAVAGSSVRALAEMALALAARVYVVVLLPGIVVYGVGMELGERLRRRR